MTTVGQQPASQPGSPPATSSPLVAMVTCRFPPQLGGTETHVSEVAQRIAASGAGVTVLTTDTSRRLPPIVQNGNLVIHRFPAWPRSADLYVSPGLARAVTAGGYGLVHVQGVHTLLPPMALATAQRAGIPTVVTFHTGGHSSRVRAALRGAQWWALRPLLRRADALVAVSDYEAALFAHHLGVDQAEIRVVRNGADPLPFDDRVPAAEGSPLICSVGRLERYKGHQRLIAAMPALRTAKPDAHLAVVGRGSYEPKLRQLADRLGVARAVTFTSFDPADRTGLGTLVRSSDVVALLSDYEAHPVAVTEALALGRKVLVAATSGLAELSKDAAVTTVAPGTEPAALARVLATVSDAPAAPPPELRNWDDCARDVLEIYRQVIEARS